VRAALADFGIACTRLTSGNACGARPGVRWCFAEPGRHDLVDTAGRKLVGSAQRRMRTDRARVLHHGSIVLERPALTPFVAAIADQRDPSTIRSALQEQLAARVAAALHLEPHADVLTEQERAEAQRWLATRFAMPDFLASY
jgi:lipoate-protein ligase A